MNSFTVLGKSRSPWGDFFSQSCHAQVYGVSILSRSSLRRLNPVTLKSTASQSCHASVPPCKTSTSVNQTTKALSLSPDSVYHPNHQSPKIMPAIVRTYSDLEIENSALRNEIKRLKTLVNEQESNKVSSDTNPDKDSSDAQGSYDDAVDYIKSRALIGVLTEFAADRALLDLEDDFNILKRSGCVITNDAIDEILQNAIFMAETLTTMEEDGVNVYEKDDEVLAFIYQLKTHRKTMNSFQITQLIEAECERLAGW